MLCTLKRLYPTFTPSFGNSQLKGNNDIVIKITKKLFTVLPPIITFSRLGKKDQVAYTAPDVHRMWTRPNFCYFP